jgi:hypothetical protein
MKKPRDARLDALELPDLVRFISVPALAMRERTSGQALDC